MNEETIASDDKTTQKLGIKDEESAAQGREDLGTQLICSKQIREILYEKVAFQERTASSESRVHRYLGDGHARQKKQKMQWSLDGTSGSSGKQQSVLKLKS